MTPNSNNPELNALLSVDSIVAGVNSLLHHPPNFANHLGDVYERFMDVQEEHQNYISLFDVDRLLRRASVPVPANVREVEFPSALVGVGSLKSVRIVPSDVRLRPIGFEIVPYQNLLNYSASLVAIADTNLPQRVPQAVAWWNDGTVGRLSFSETFDRACTLSITYEPAGKTLLNPEADANVLQNAHSFVKAEVAMRCLDLFLIPETPAYKAREKQLLRQIASSSALLEEWLSSADEEEGGFIPGWGRASNVQQQGTPWGMY